MRCSWTKLTGYKVSQAHTPVPTGVQRAPWGVDLVQKINNQHRCVLSLLGDRKYQEWDNLFWNAIDLSNNHTCKVYRNAQDSVLEYIMVFINKASDIGLPMFNSLIHWATQVAPMFNS